MVTDASPKILQDPLLYDNMRLHLNHLWHQTQKLCSNLYREKCQIWSLQVHMSNRMTKLSTRNAKDTIIEHVIVVRIFVTRKCPNLRRKSSSHTLVILCIQKQFPQKRKPRAIFSIAGLSARISFSNSDLCWVSDTEALSTSRSSACWNYLIAPWCSYAQNECHVISSPYLWLAEDRCRRTQQSSLCKMHIQENVSANKCRDMNRLHESMQWSHGYFPPIREAPWWQYKIHEYFTQPSHKHKLGESKLRRQNKVFYSAHNRARNTKGTAA